MALFLCKVIEDTSFNGGLQLFFLGIPLVLALVWLTRDSRKDEMNLSAN